MEVKEIYHNECDCFFADNILDNDCRKRYFEVLDLESNKTVRIFICNEHLRLLLYKITAEEKRKDKYSYTKSHTIYDVIHSILSKYVNFYKTSRCGSICNHGNAGMLKRTLNVTICNRPYIVAHLTLFEAVNLSLKFKHSYVRNELYEFINDALKTYKSYKYNNLKSINNKILKTIDIEERTILVNELFTEVLKIK